MRSVLVAPDSFKGTFSAGQVAAAISSGIRASQLGAIELPVADGGEGTLAVLADALGLAERTAASRDAWGAEITAGYGLAADATAVIELARTSGFASTHDRARDPMTASTYGVGMLVIDAVRAGARRIVVAAGGSASTDGGAGALAAISDGGGLAGAHLRVLTDVTNPFLDAATIFAPQKGADAQQVAQLTDRLQRLAQAWPRDPRKVAGSGAAGGFAGGMWAALGADLVPGAAFVLDALDIDGLLRSVVAVVVGEGRLDSQSQHGKIVSAVVDRARAVAVYAVVGSRSGELGSLADRFAAIHVAADELEMRAAGARISAAVSSAGNRRRC